VQQGWGGIECAGVDVPSIVVLRVIGEGLEFVAAGIGSEGIEAAALVEQRGDAAGLGIYGDADYGVFERLASAG